MDNDSSWDETGWDSDPALDSEDEHQIGDSWLDRIFNKKHREETLDDQINAARDRVANYYSSGQADQHRERLAADDHYRETL